MFFFIMGINSGRKDLDFHQTMICSSCGRYGNYTVYMTYTVLSLFFIPCFKWNKKYYVQTSCCHKVYELDPDVGRRIARGESVEIRPEDLTPTGRGSWQSSWNGNGGWGQYDQDNNGSSIVLTKRCSNCGFTTEEDYDYCPKCGHPL